MREGIHPKYFQATVTCNCGNTLQWLPRVVSISSTGNMAWATTNIDTKMQTARQQRGLRCVLPLLLYIKDRY